MSCLSSRLCHGPISVSSLLSHLPIFVTLAQLFASCLSFSSSSFTVSMCLIHIKISPFWSAHPCSSHSLGVQVRLAMTVTVFARPEGTSRPCCPCPLPRALSAHPSPIRPCPNNATAGPVSSSPRCCSAWPRP